MLINKSGRTKQTEPLTPEEYMGDLWMVCFNCGVEVMTTPRIEKITIQPPKGLETDSTVHVKCTRYCPSCKKPNLGRPTEHNLKHPLASHPEILMGDGRVLL